MKLLIYYFLQSCVKLQRKSEIRKVLLTGHIEPAISMRFKNFRGNANPTQPIRFSGGPFVLEILLCSMTVFSFASQEQTFSVSNADQYSLCDLTRQESYQVLGPPVFVQNSEAQLQLKRLLSSAMGTAVTVLQESNTLCEFIL